MLLIVAPDRFLIGLRAAHFLFEQRLDPGIIIRQQPAFGIGQPDSHDVEPVCLIKQQLAKYQCLCGCFPRQMGFGRRVILHLSKNRRCINFMPVYQHWWMFKYLSHDARPACVIARPDNRASKHSGSVRKACAPAA